MSGLDPITTCCRDCDPTTIKSTRLIVYLGTPGMRLDNEVSLKFSGLMYFRSCASKRSAGQFLSMDRRYYFVSESH
jgi:hypothetical protein